MTETSTDHIVRISPEALDTLFLRARTANSFSSEPIPDETLRELFALAELGPTAMNSVPGRIVFVKSAEGKARLLPAVAPGNRDKTAQAPVTAIIAADGDFHEKLELTFPHMQGAKDRFPDPEQRAGFASSNTWLQLGYFIMAARALGLAAGPLTGFDKDAVKREFFADNAYSPVALVNLGLPGENPWFDRLPRLDFDQAAAII